MKKIKIKALKLVRDINRGNKKRKVKFKGKVSNSDILEIIEQMDV